MKKGFTLIELSIVLVIIGLIIGGVLVGQDLIQAGKIRAQVKQLQDFELAYNTFELKYGCMPGDCPNVTTFFPTADNGSGDKQIACDGSGLYGANVFFRGRECVRFFHHLSLAQLVSGDYDGTITGAFLNLNVSLTVDELPIPFVMAPNQTINYEHWSNGVSLFSILPLHQYPHQIITIPMAYSRHWN